MLLDSFPIRTGHFVLESGYHTDLWLTLDALFVSPPKTAPLVEALAERIRPHHVSAVCGPLQGGAFLAQTLAAALEVEFYFTHPVTTEREGSKLFAAEYKLPAELATRVKGTRVAVVDDVISAGSSVRATAAAIDDAGGSTVVVAALVLLGRVGADHFARLSIPVESLEQRDLKTWEPGACPLCAAGVPLEQCG